MGKYEALTREELVRLLEARDRREATRFGLVWESGAVERDQALNTDYVALDPVPELCCGDGPWTNLVIEGDNFDALRALRPGFAGKVQCLATDPPYNTGNRDFLYNDRFLDKEDLWRHSKWLEFMHQRLTLARDLLAQDGAAFVHIDDNDIFRVGTKLFAAQWVIYSTFQEHGDWMLQKPEMIGYHNKATQNNAVIHETELE